MITRHLRFVLAGIAVLSAAGAEARPRAVPASAASGVTVDVARLRAIGLGPIADLVQAAVARELAGGFSGPLPAGRVVVQVTGLSMSSYAGSDSGGGGGTSSGSGSGGTVDYMEGDLLVLGPGGEVIARKHQVSSSPASSGGAYYLPGAEQRRVEAIARTFAAWLKRSPL